MRRSPTSLSLATAPTSRKRSTHLLAGALATLLLAAAPTVASAQVEQTPIEGFLGGGYLASFRDIDSGGRSSTTGHGGALNLGLRYGDTFAWLLGYELTIQDDYDTHFIPATMRVYSPTLLDIFALYGQAGVGMFFVRDHDQNERAAAWRVGGGVEVDITESISAYVDGGWTNGLGSVSSYKYATVGAGIVLHWGGGEE